MLKHSPEAPIDREQLCRNAEGLQKTTEYMIEAGRGNETALSIARHAAANLLRTAKQVTPPDPVVASLEVNGTTTWSEIHSLTTVILSANQK